MTDGETQAAQHPNPDTPGLEAQGSAATGSAVRDTRIRTGLTQAEFARTYGIPLGTLRGWEQGQVQPDATARSYLRAIENDPEAVAWAFGRAA